MISLVLVLLPISAVLSQFVPRYPYYSPNDFLLEYYSPSPSSSLFSVDPYPAYGSSQFSQPQPAPRAYGERQVVLRDLPMAGPQQQKFDPFARQPGVAPKLSGFVHSSTRAPAHAATTFESNDLFTQPGAAPRFTGSFLKNREDTPVLPRLTPAQLKAYQAEEAEAAAHRKPDVAVNAFQGPITNPAAHFLSGTHFEKISTPKCRMLNCAGPVPNDGSLSTTPTLSGKRSACSQVLVPINGCAGGDGYPMAMLCSVCCECTAPLVSELLKSAANFRA